MKNTIKKALATLKDFLESNEPVDMTRIIPAVLQEEFEESISLVLEQTMVLECHIEKGVYFINMEHSGVRPGMGSTPLKVIPRISQVLRRFYRNQGIPLAKNEVHIMYSANGLVIEIALNNYGLKQIRRRNYEQATFLRQRYGR